VNTDRIRVLVVDDHKMFAESLVNLLEREEDLAIVGQAGSVGELKRVLQETEPDVVLMDYRLPDGDGIEAAGYVRRERSEAQIVMLTGMSDDTVLLRAIDAGCAGFVTKDNAVEEAVAAIRAAASGEAVISPHMLSRLLPKLRREREQEPQSPLTPREREVLLLLAEGLSNGAIAERLFISLNTVRNHVQNLLSKLGAHSKLEAVAIAARNGLVDR